MAALYKQRQWGANKKEPFETYVLIHVIALRVNNLGDSNLGDLNGTGQAGTARTTPRQ